MQYFPKKQQNYIYITGSKFNVRGVEIFTDGFGVGKTNDLNDRLSSLQGSKNTEIFFYICKYHFNFDVSQLEKKIHLELLSLGYNNYRINDKAKKELFYIKENESYEDIIKTIDQIIIDNNRF